MKNYNLHFAYSIIYFRICWKAGAIIQIFTWQSWRKGNTFGGRSRKPGSIRALWTSTRRLAINTKIRLAKVVWPKWRTPRTDPHIESYILFPVWVTMMAHFNLASIGRRKRHIRSTMRDFFLWFFFVPLPSHKLLRLLLGPPLLRREMFGFAL